jgi:serine/threonine protein kinase
MASDSSETAHDASAALRVDGERATPLSAGLEIDGRYVLEAPLGRGGMGEVWTARHRLLDRSVALKFLRSSGEALQRMLLEEGRILASVRHPAVVEVYDCGIFAERLPYLVMELVHGETLRATLDRERALTCRAAVELVIPVLYGVHAAHERGVPHRDIKPENILRTSGGASPVKLIDFGIAHQLSDRAAHGRFSGTPSYMAPEQVRGEPGDRRVDVWAMGATLYELVAGRPPFDGEDDSATMANVLEGNASFPRAAVGLDGALWKIIMSSLRVDPARRTASALDLAASLEGWLATSGRARSSQPNLVRESQPVVAAGALSDARDAPERTLDELIRDKLSQT